jgi:hypothetical protein
VLLHPNIAGYYCRKAGALAETLDAEENRAESADLIRSLLDQITLTSNPEGKLDIDLYGNLASILALPANKDRPLDASDPSVVQVKVVAAGGGGGLNQPT